MKLYYYLLLLLTFDAYGQVAPFLTTTWNQTCYYNALMPTVSTGGACGRAYTGCNATAMAQICNYYAYPITGFGSHCNSNSPTDCVDYDLANYNYASMPSNVSSVNPAVATLMYDLGVAVDMDWNGTNSTSFFSVNALKEHFAYSPRMYASATFLFSTTAELIAAIKNEMDNGRPVFCKGGGHFYLIDGYNASDNFHMNFGWGGTYDNYYPINNVVNGAGTFTPSNFIFGIRPLQGDLETAKDTIVINATGVVSENIEFTSTLDWTMWSSEAWITPNILSGTKGFINFSDGSTFSSPVNNGMQRTGYIYVQNANDTDTIVVIQDASTLQSTPNPINFPYSGGTQTVNVTFSSWATWNASTSSPWISLTPSSGTGSGNFDVTAVDNTGGSARSGYVLLTGGAFTDSILVTQDEDISVGLTDHSDLQFQIAPNPAFGEITILGLSKDKFTYEIRDLNQKLCFSGTLEDHKINVSTLASGVYILRISDDHDQFTKRIVVR